MNASPLHRLGKRSRGFTVIVALLLLSMVSVALVCTAQLVRQDSRRTFDERLGAELRTLMLSAMTDTRVRLDNDGGLAPNGQVILPSDLADATLTTEARKEGEQWIVRIAARIDSTEADEEITFAQDGRRWRVRDAEIDNLSVRRQATR